MRLFGAGPDPAGDPIADARQRLVDAVERDVRAWGTGDGGHELDPRVRAALAKVPRERFVPGADPQRAYLNRALPIGHGQTISQPLVVALMTHHLHLAPGSRVLEVGTGSGYQTAILAELAQEVVTIEVLPSLAEAARAILDQLGYRNIVFRVGDGSAGAPDLTPFDGILVTAAAREVPSTLIDQLTPRGRMVIPVGGFATAQDLILLAKNEDGRVSERVLFPVAFVPLTGGGRQS